MENNKEPLCFENLVHPDLVQTITKNFINNIEKQSKDDLPEIIKDKINGLNKKTNAVEILNDIYIRNSAIRRESMKNERLIGQIAVLFYNIRTQNNLNHHKFAKLIEISEKTLIAIEDSDCDVFDITPILDKILGLINKKLNTIMVIHIYSMKRKIEEEENRQLNVIKNDEKELQKLRNYIKGVIKE